MDQHAWAIIEQQRAWIEQHADVNAAEFARLGLLKIMEEAGEAASALSGATAANPRKGQTHTMADVADELADVALASLVALAAIADDPRGVLAAKLGHVYTRSLEHGAAPLPKAVHKPREIWLSELPKVLLAAVMVLCDTEGRVLLVHQPYSPTDRKWSLPGGGAHDDEPPRLIARRECLEELALNIEPGTLLCTDWMHATDRPPIITFAYDGGVLDDEQIARIQLTDGELSEYRFVTVDQAEMMMPEVHFRRLAAAVNSRTGQAACTDLQDGVVVAPQRAPGHGRGFMANRTNR